MLQDHVCEYAHSDSRCVQAFEPHMDAFVPILLQDVSCSNQLCRAAAADCKTKVQRRLGSAAFIGFDTPSRMW